MASKFIDEEELKRRLAEQAAEEETNNNNAFSALQNIIAEGNAQKNAGFQTNQNVNNWLGFNMATASPLRKALLEPETYTAPLSGGRSHGGGGRSDSEMQSTSNPLKSITFEDLQKAIAEGNANKTKEKDTVESNPAFDSWLGFDMGKASPVRVATLGSETYTTPKRSHGGSGAAIPENTKGEKDDETEPVIPPSGEGDGDGEKDDGDSGKIVSYAGDYIEELIEKIRSGRTSYSDRLDNLINDYMNRERFSYDPNADMLYQNYLAAMQNAGKMAMKDTMGQASMLTGGYGSSYATAAANGAYNNYLQKANDALPDYYNIAANAYEREGDDLLSQIKLLQNQDNDEYNRYVTALKNELSGTSSGTSSEKSPYTNTQFNNIREDLTKAFNEGGLEKYEAEAALIKDLPEAEKDAIDEWILDNGEVHYEMTSDGEWPNFVASNEYKDSWGETHTYAELEEMYEKGEISKETWDAIKKLTQVGQSTRTKK